MGRILIRNGRAADGVAWLREALRCAPDDRAAHAELAAYYAAAGQPELAADHRRFADRP
jgi:Flp pilus assembly protein TadD